MADISAEIDAFQNAVYGEDVRSSMVSLANKLNDLISSSDLGKILAQQIYFATPDGKFYTKTRIFDGDSYASLLIRWTGNIAHQNVENHGYIFPINMNVSVTNMLYYVSISYRYEDEDGLIWIRIPDANVLVYDGVDKIFAIVSRSIVDGIRYIPMIGNNNGNIVYGFYSSLIFTDILQNNVRLSAIEADGYVTTNKLADDAVTDSKLMKNGGIISKVLLTEEQTDNINDVSYDRCYVTASGEIYYTPGNSSYVGMTDKLRVIGGSYYNFSLHGYEHSGSLSLMLAQYSFDKSFIRRDSYQFSGNRTIQLMSETSYICVSFNDTISIIPKADFIIQIVKGVVAQERINPYTSIDNYARKKVINLARYIDSGEYIDCWMEDCAFYMSNDNPTPIDVANSLDGYRCCVIEVSEGDIIYYSGSNYSSEDIGSAAKPYGFYNSKKEIISYADNAIYENHKIVIGSGVKYIALNQSEYIGYKDCYLRKLPERAQAEEELFAINRTLQIVDDYMDESLIYDSGCSPWYWTESEYEKAKGLTCSDWGMLSFFGIARDNTIWNGMKNIRGYGFDSYKDIYNLKSKNYVWSSGICKYADEKGYTFTPNEDMTNCKPGDIIFYNMNPNDDDTLMDWPPVPVGTEDTSDWPKIKEYRGIDHCAVFVDRVSSSFYSIIEVTGYNGEGYPAFRYTPIKGSSARDVKGAIRPIVHTPVLPKLLYKESVTKITVSTEKYITLDTAIQQNTWVTIIVKAVTKGESYMGIQVKYIDEPSYTESLSTESSFGGKNSRENDTVRFLFSPEKPFKTFRIVSFGTPNDVTRGMYIYNIEVYSGFSRGSI